MIEPINIVAITALVCRVVFGGIVYFYYPRPDKPVIKPGFLQVGALEIARWRRNRAWVLSLDVVLCICGLLNFFLLPTPPSLGVLLTEESLLVANLMVNLILHRTVFRSAKAADEWIPQEERSQKPLN